jgi:hypothetical protein
MFSGIETSHPRIIQLPHPRRAATSLARRRQAADVAIRARGATPPIFRLQIHNHKMRGFMSEREMQESNLPGKYVAADLIRPSAAEAAIKRVQGINNPDLAVELRQYVLSCGLMNKLLPRVKPGYFLESTTYCFASPV